MGKNGSVGQNTGGGRHSPDRATDLQSGGGGSIGGQHSPKDPQSANDKGLNAPASPGSSKKDGK